MLRPYKVVRDAARGMEIYSGEAGEGGGCGGGDA